ncbi:hypothetical protein AB0G64_10970 [Streptomyces longwoodensis]|uniref:hypothetical protein n=1 Tax=Streptomyces longwoodensis TaxID=68231 RepID=UPI0033E9F050
MNAPVTRLSPATAGPAIRVMGAVVVDLSAHVDRGILMGFRPTVEVPPGGYAPGTNVEIHIGEAHRVYEGDANLHAIATAAQGCTVVVKGRSAEGVTQAQRVLTLLATMTQQSELGGYRPLRGPSDTEGSRP